MKNATQAVKDNWDPKVMLGPENAQSIGYAATVANLHELPATIVHMVAALHAMDGLLLKIRQKPIPTSLGFVFYHYAKTNKSGLQSMVDEAMHKFQILVNRKELELIQAKRKQRDDAVLTTTYMKGVTPERFFAKCDADMEGRSFCSMLLGHDEFAGWAEEVGLLPGGKGTKERQANLNIAFDTGRPSKDYQDEKRSYGVDIYAMFQHEESGRPPRRVVLHHLSGLNARDALKMMGDESVHNTAMALRERYLLFTAPVVNPYEVCGGKRVCFCACASTILA
jgi:hypothetical protein